MIRRARSRTLRVALLVLGLLAGSSPLLAQATEAAGAPVLPGADEAPPPDPPREPAHAAVAHEGKAGPKEVSAASRRAELQAFFARDGGVGDLMELMIPPEDGKPRLLKAVDGGIAFASLHSPVIHMLGPRGGSTLDIGEHVVDFGFLRGRGTLWFTARQGRFYQQARVDPPGENQPRRIQTRGRFMLDHGGGLDLHFTGQPGGLVVTPSGHAWLPRKSGMAWFDGRQLFGKPVTVAVPSPRPGFLAKELAAGPGESLLAWADGDYFRIKPRPQGKGGTMQGGHVEKGGRACLAEGDLVYVAVPKEDKIVVIDTGREPPALRTIDLARAPDGSRNARLGIFDLAVGPDGHLWLTAQAANAVLRLNPATAEVDGWELPIPNSFPTYIVNGGDGNMYFLETGGGRIGRITAQAPRPEPPPAAFQAAASDWIPDLPAPRRISARRLRHLRPAREPVPAAVPQVPEAHPAEPAVPPGPAPAAVDAPRAPEAFRDALEREGLAVDWGHVIADHRYGAPNSKGQFLQFYCDDHLERMAGLIYQAVFDPTYPLILDTDGCWLAMREFDNWVGYYRKDGRWHKTKRLRVVLSPGGDQVKTAYPLERF